MILVDPSPFLSLLFSFTVVGVGLASWLGGDADSEPDAGDAQDVDDEFAMDDDDLGMEGFDDDFGGMDESGGTGASSSELENRIEDLESEIANVSSTANTVRSENEQISEKVDDVEENVRKLLEIYEMVTRGVNPFVDDVSAEAGMSGDGGSFGLFADEDEETQDADEEDLDSDLAEAEADEFFDDDAFDDFDEGGGDEDEFGDDMDEFDEMDDFDDEMGGMDDDMDGDLGMDDVAGMEDDVEAIEGDAAGMEDEMAGMDDAMGLDDDGAETDDGDSGGGTSFEELKEEYESGDADWADEDLADDETVDDGAMAETDDASLEDDGEDDEDLFHEDDLVGEDDAPDVSESTDTVVDHDESGMATDPEAPSAENTPDPEPAPTTAAANEESGVQFDSAGTPDRDDHPYLHEPPAGFLADVVVLEWLEYLVETHDARNAVRAINYYERIGWIGEPMRDHLVSVLSGITEADYLYRDEIGSTDLTMHDHRKSLGYVEDLAGDRLDRMVGDRIQTAEADGI